MVGVFIQIQSIIYHWKVIAESFPMICDESNLDKNSDRKSPPNFGGWVVDGFRHWSRFGGRAADCATVNLLSDLVDGLAAGCCRDGRPIRLLVQLPPYPLDPTTERQLSASPSAELMPVSQAVCNPFANLCRALTGGVFI